MNHACSNLKSSARLLAAGLAFGMTAVVLAGPTQDTKPAKQPAAPQAAAPAKDLPEAKVILDKSLDAAGGKDAFDAIESTTIKGEMTMPMGAVSLEIYTAKPDRLFFRQLMPGGGEMAAGFDGEIGWTINPMTGGYTLLGEEEVEQLREQADMQSMLLRLVEKHETTKTIDLTEFDGRQCYELLAEDEEAGENAAAPPAHIFFDADTHLMVGMEMQDMSTGNPIPILVKFKDWKKVGEVKFYHQMIIEQMGMQMAMNFTEVGLDNVDPAVFELPDEVKKLVDEQKEAPATQPEEPNNEG